MSQNSTGTATKLPTPIYIVFMDTNYDIGPFYVISFLLAVTQIRDHNVAPSSPFSTTVSRCLLHLYRENTAALLYSVDSG